MEGGEGNTVKLRSIRKIKGKLKIKKRIWQRQNKTPTPLRCGRTPGKVGRTVTKVKEKECRRKRERMTVGGRYKEEKEEELCKEETELKGVGFHEYE